MTDINIVEGKPTWSGDPPHTLFMDAASNLYYLTYPYEGNATGVGTWSLCKEIALTIEAVVRERNTLREKLRVASIPKDIPTEGTIGRSYVSIPISIPVDKEMMRACLSNGYTAEHLVMLKKEGLL